MSKVVVQFEQRTFYWYLERLDLEGARRIGERDVLARCPAHEDYSPSLHLREHERPLRSSSL